MPDEKKPLPPGASISFTALDGPSQSVRYTLESLPSSIGSGPEADVTLPGMGVAPMHAQIALLDNEVFLEDLGSGKITRANTRNIKRARLQNGDIIEIGDIRLLFHLTLPAAPAKAGSGAARAKTTPKVWAVGFSAEFREWFVKELGGKLKFEAEAFGNGEDVLTAMSKALGDGSPPSLLLLDLRIPIMNGINVAIAVRAYEQGFRQEEKIPLIFMFDPPEQTSFEKVIKFCQPLRVVPPGEGEEGLKIAARKVIKGAKF